MKCETFVQDLEDFLRNSNPNLGRKSPKREKFIKTIVNMVRDFLATHDPTEVTSKAPKEKRLQSLGPDRLLRINPSDRTKQFSAKKGGVALMTESESMKGDEELGIAPMME